MTPLITFIVAFCAGVLIGEIGDRHNIPKSRQYLIGAVVGPAIGLAGHIISRS